MKGIFEQIESVEETDLKPLTVEGLQSMFTHLQEKQKTASKEWTVMVSRKEYEEFGGDIEKILNNRVEILNKQLK